MISFRISVGVVTCKAFNVIDLILQNLTMIRMPVAKSCFLSEGTENVPKPADLVKLLVSFSFSFLFFFLYITSSCWKFTASIIKDRTNAFEAVRNKTLVH